MVRWMDTVDQSLKNIMREVNTIDEFEKEKVIFQVNFNISHRVGITV
jgi:nesprin-1